jgi:Mce-associated membrane protein
VTEQLTHERTEPQQTAPPREDPRPVRGARARWVVLGVLVALIVASLGYLGVRIGQGEGSLGNRVSQAFHPTQSSLSTDRDAAMSQARQFALRVNTYGPDMLQGKTMPAYRAQVEPVITDKLKAQFDQSATLADATVAENGLERTCDVYATGVAAIDASTATVLVAGDFTFSYPKHPGSKQYVRAADELFRWEVQLDKVDGTWLVDSFGPAESGKVSTTSGTTGAQ